MIIELAKFGVTLISRQDGREAFLAFNSILNSIKQNEIVVIDFNGVNTFAPGWADEFLSPLQVKHGDKLILKNLTNPSAKATIQILEQTNNVKFNIKN